MVTRFSYRELIEIPKVLSKPRFDTYLATQCVNHRRAISLYEWNCLVSAAFLFPISICEISLRNAIEEVLRVVYGQDWPWSPTFEQSLPNPKRGYSPRIDLVERRARQTSSSKIVAELSFAFWESMLTSRHDGRLWRPHLTTAFPSLPPAGKVRDLRNMLHDQVTSVRRLRNRIAHHEPIFSRDLVADYHRIISLVRCRSPETADWVDRVQGAAAVAAKRP